MRTIKIVGRNRIFSPLCLIKAVHNYGKPFWTKAVEFYSDGRDFTRTIEILLGRSRFYSDGRDFTRTVEILLGRSRFLTFLDD